MYSMAVVSSQGTMLQYHLFVAQSPLVRKYWWVQVNKLHIVIIIKVILTSLTTISIPFQANQTLGYGLDWKTDFGKLMTVLKCKQQVCYFWVLYFFKFPLPRALIIKCNVKKPEIGDSTCSLKFVNKTAKKRHLCLKSKYWNY